MRDIGDVVIVGGGAAGCAVAYYLGQAGVKATLIEREGIGMQASGYSAGGVNPLHGLATSMRPLAMASFKLHLALWDELRQTTGRDCDACDHGRRSFILPADFARIRIHGGAPACFSWIMFSERVRGPDRPLDRCSLAGARIAPVSPGPRPACRGGIAGADAGRSVRGVPGAPYAGAGRTRLASGAPR